MRGTGPLWDCGDVIAESSVVDLMYEDAEEGGRLLVWVRLEFGLNLDDECGSYGGEQTSLKPESAHHKYEGHSYARISAWCSDPRRISW